MEEGKCFETHIFKCILTYCFTDDSLEDCTISINDPTKLVKFEGEFISSTSFDIDVSFYKGKNVKLEFDKH